MRLVWLFEHSKLDGQAAFKRNPIGPGMFHEWAVQSYELDNERMGSEVVAIIELPDGTVKTFGTYHIEFINNGSEQWPRQKEK